MSQFFFYSFAAANFGCCFFLSFYGRDFGRISNAIFIRTLLPLPLRLFFFGFSAKYRNERILAEFRHLMLSLDCENLLTIHMNTEKIKPMLNILQKMYKTKSGSKVKCFDPHTQINSHMLNVSHDKYNE